MYREDLVYKIQKSESKEEQTTLLGEFYFANLGLIVNLCKEVCPRDDYLDELLQIAYLALHKTVQKFDASKGFSILSNYRNWFRNECYQLWLKSGARMKVYSIHDVCEHLEVNDMFLAVEIDFMNQQLWERVEYLLDVEELSIIKRRFIAKQTYSTIAADYKVSYECIRMRIKKACKKMKSDRVMQGIAEFYDF